MRYRFVFTAMLTALAAGAAQGTPSDAALRFGAREEVGQISLSPGGTLVSYLQPVNGRGTAVVIADLATGTTKPVMASSGDRDQLRWCRWSSDTRLVCGVVFLMATGDGDLSFTRLVAVDADGRNLKVLSARATGIQLGYAQSGGGVIDWLGDGQGKVLMTHDYVPEQTTGTRLANDKEGLGVDRVDTGTLVRSAVEPARKDAVEYITDGHGAVRIMGIQVRNDSGYLNDKLSYFYRKPGERSWQPLGTLAVDMQTASGFNPYAVDSDKNLVYGFDVKDGRQALYSIALDGSMKRDLVMARGDVDVDGLVRIGRQNRTVGVSFATDRRQTEFFDPELGKLQVALGKAVPGLPLITFVDASADERKLLLWAGSDVDPGRYYLFDKTTRHLAEVMPVRPQLAAVKLATVRSISYKAADGTAIPAYLTLPPEGTGKGLPAIVMPHGGPGDRDEWGFDWLAQFFANRGYAVLQPNFRGSTGYGSDWFQKNGFRSWKTAIGDVDDAGRWLVAEGIAAPSTLAIVGWSYGGYAALQSAATEPGLFKAVVAVAPVTDLATLKEERRFFTDFRLVESFVGTGEHIKAGSPAQNADRIAVPVLLFHGTRDQNVGIGESRLMAAKLKGAGKKVELVEFDGLDHQLDDATARATLLDRADGFLRASMGM